jgi:D-cysteine desulfhydrase
VLTDDLPRVSIAHLPTPLEELPRLTALLEGPELWVKRDDQTGLATGGNKTRKLEFLVADALDGGADTLITCGAAQSNHARQTAAAAAKFGLDCILVLRGELPEQVQGNLLIDEIVGARVIWTAAQPTRSAALDATMDAVASDLRADGHRPYVVPYGGSNTVGASGYVAAMEELIQQSEDGGLTFDHIVFPSSSGGTQAGLVVGAKARGYAGRLLGVSVDPPAADLRRNLATLATALAACLQLDLHLDPHDFAVDDGYVGGGYAVVSDLEREAMHMLGRTEGLLLDPVYTGRAFGALLDLVRRGVFRKDERVLFWHTGGVAGLFGYADRL